jgi:hypothetical protein
MMWVFWLFAVIVLTFGFVVFWGAPYVPSKKKELAEAFDTLYSVGAKDVLVDIGSGDGVVLRAAAARGARAVGYELNPLLVLLTRWLSRGQPRVEAKTANFWHMQVPSDTTIIYVFAVSRDIVKLTHKIAQEATRLGRPLLVMSYGCEIPDMTPIQTHGAHGLYEIMPLQTQKPQV